MKNPVRVIVLGFALFLVVVAATIAVRLGLFKDPELMGPTNMNFAGAYIEHIGPYHEVGPLFETVEKKGKGLGWKCDRTFGHYLDDPEKVDNDRLRAHIGCLLSPNESFEGKTTDLIEFESEGKEYLKYLFRGSPAAGPIKVYPKAKEWFIQEGIVMFNSVIEVYRRDANDEYITEYYFPLP